MTNKIIVKTAWKNMRRNPWLTFTSVLVITLTSFITLVFIITALGSNFILNYLESKAQITAFFKDEVLEDEILNLKGELEKTGKVSEIAYISKEEALQIYTGQHQDEPVLLESITANIFPASLEIRAKEISDLPEIAKALEGREGIEEVIFYKDIIETFRSWTKTARIVGLFLILILGGISVLIVLVTIGLTIHTKGKEIEITKLLGATDWYIRWPFLLQGSLYGATAAVLSTIFLSFILPFILPYINTLFRGIPLPKITPLFLLKVSLLQVFLSSILGAVGSLAAIHKYLKT